MLACLFVISAHLVLGRRRLESARVAFFFAWMSCSIAKLPFVMFALCLDALSRKQALVRALAENVAALSQDQYGCRVIQKARLEKCKPFRKFSARGCRRYSCYFERFRFSR